MPARLSGATGAAGAIAAMLVFAAPARADVIAQTDQGFVSRNVAVMAGSPAAVWKRLVTPSAWWSSDHTFSGDAANLTLDPVAGGCFCERLPADDDKPVKPGAPHPPPRGGVQHMRVVFVDHAKALRMVGALGPLQSEAANATLTVTLKDVEGGTRVVFEYVVGGYMRYPADKISAAVDTVMANQLISLAKPFGAVAGARDEPAPGPASSAGPKLDKNGVLLPRGKIWSLPSGPPPEAPAKVAPVDAAPVTAPLPTAPMQEDVAPAGGGATQAPSVATQEQPLTVTPQTDAAPSPAHKTRARPAKTPKPAPKPASPDEPTKDSVNTAFDAAFGGAPPPN